jgi:hypothetical protein
MMRLYWPKEILRRSRRNLEVRLWSKLSNSTYGWEVAEMVTPQIIVSWQIGAIVVAPSSPDPVRFIRGAPARLPAFTPTPA